MLFPCPVGADGGVDRRPHDDEGSRYRSDLRYFGEDCRCKDHPVNRLQGGDQPRRRGADRTEAADKEGVSGGGVRGSRAAGILIYPPPSSEWC